MKIDGDKVRILREQKAWSQEHLASVAGLSVRTIQRVESEGGGLPETRLARPLVKDPQPARVVRVFRVFELQIGEDIRHQIDHREVNVEPVAQFELRGPGLGRAQRRRKSGVQHAVEEFQVGADANLLQNRAIGHGVARRLLRRRRA